MNSNLNYKTFIIQNFCKKYNINQTQLIKNEEIYFRYICFKYNFFLKHIKIPVLKTHSDYECVLIDFNRFPHVEFLIRNAILKLGIDWSFTIICGNLNYEFMINICKNISIQISVIKVNINEVTINDYNKLLTSKSFWNLFYGEKILIYHEDSIIIKNNIKKFLKYDFIGSPFLVNEVGISNLIGKGNFSLRNKSLMLKILEECPIKKTVENEIIVEYIKSNNLDYPPEDIYFSLNLQKLEIGKIADYDDSILFASEGIFNNESFGGHKIWIGNSNWKETLKNEFKYSLYLFKSDISTYLKYLNIDLNFQNKTNKNSFDVDLTFCNVVNNLNFETENEIIKYIQCIGIDGFIYHPKQILNILPSIKIYSFLENIFIMYNLKLYLAQTFVKKYIYENTLENFVKNTIKNRYYNLNILNSTLLLVFIGNEERGIELIEKIINYKKIQSFNVAFCFNSNINIFDKIKKIIEDNFTYFSIYESKEFGTDITPTLLMYNEITNFYGKNTFKHIIKLHSKSIINHFTFLTDFLLTKTIDELILLKNPDCNCIGHPDFYISLNNDPFNNDLKLKYFNNIIINNYFVGGTIFYSSNIIFDKTFDFLKLRFRSYLLNNLYENNSINSNNSPIHFLERIFGIIKLN